ncbi:response regulator transcription factor [Microbacterium esteraromaticum]|uniref:Response regulator transcription factor n=1 Tax=Microbacterium esteraromaticum TaxID=57043 RepID=A0A939DZG0_9MICO|nr:response regulator transcription factor [Microbacterium esteraromaticum]MBN8206808.1 response regulator transcription factor [Microbacterium esteraromaticum]MBN8416963.1 response regulator transcription factor [Microbacterium esteraromaticum]MBN8425590.1 response regulator transcription factor [Microbacterium esteraromaticum]
MAELRLLLVDDEQLVRAGLRLLLDGSEGIRIVGEANDGLSAVEAYARVRPDLVLMDVRMPRMNGIQATAQILSEDPAARILILTTFDADAEVLGALQSGAQGYLLKDTPPVELVAALHDVAHGRMMLSPSVTRQLVGAATSGRSEGRRQAALDRLALLTPREREVAEAVGKGLTNAEITQALYLSLATVKTHVRRIMEKLPAENRVQVAICVHEAGPPAADG